MKINLSKLYKITSGSIFVFGAGIHLLRLLVGDEFFVNIFFTPVVDGIFGLVMVVSAIAGWGLRSRIMGGRWLRGVFFFGLLMITISIPIHLRGFFIGSTEYITNFPQLYSLVEIPMFLALFYSVTRLRFSENS